MEALLIIEKIRCCAIYRYVDINRNEVEYDDIHSTHRTSFGSG